MNRNPLSEFTPFSVKKPAQLLVKINSYSDCAPTSTPSRKTSITSFEHVLCRGVDTLLVLAIKSSRHHPFDFQVRNARKLCNSVR
jgi:hypothetical protein